MGKNMRLRRFLSLLLTAAFIFTMIPFGVSGTGRDALDVWAEIARFEDRRLASRFGVDAAQATAREYASLTDGVIKLVSARSDFKDGSIDRHGDFFYWEDVDGMVYGYSPALRERLRAAAAAPADKRTSGSIRFESEAQNSAASVAVIQPYYGIDSSFTDQYPKEAANIAAVIGGSYTVYRKNDATIDAVASSLSECSAVIFDSHGDTDYASGTDYTSRANTSYICLQSGAGITSADMAAANGEFGTYRHAFYGGSDGEMNIWCVDGAAIANHMDGASSNGILWMALCLGMATDGLAAPLHEKGVGVVYGYSQSVTFGGDYLWEEAFWDKMIAGENVASAIAYMKQKVGIKDPYEKIDPAYPIVVSDEDVYPGHGNVDAEQEVRSTWVLHSPYKLTATVNDPSMGSIEVAGSRIKVRPEYGFEVSDCRITAGAGTVKKIDGGFYINMKSDCTVLVTFAPRESASIRLVLPDGADQPDIDLFVGDTITVAAPDAEYYTPDDGYEFIGWADGPCIDSREAPEYMKVGTVFTVTGDRMFYPLYRYITDDPELIEQGKFKRVTSMPAELDGEYVIVYNDEVILDASGEFTGDDTGYGFSRFGDAGITVDGDTLTGVDGKFVYQFETRGEKGEFSMRMKTGGLYLARSAKALHTLTTSENADSDNALFRMSFSDDGAIDIRSMHLYPNYVFGYRIGKETEFFVCDNAGSSAANRKKVAIFADDSGTVRFTTEPKKLCDHVFVWSSRIEPTCTGEGVETYVCSKCGEKLDTTLPMIDHVYIENPAEAHLVSAASCTERAVYHKSCSRCGAESEDTFEYGELMPHPFGEWKVIREPSFDAAGEQERVCAACGEREIDEIPKLRFENPFTDVPDDAWFANGVLYCFNKGLMTGTSDTTFSPNAPFTRAMFVTVLAKVDGADTSAYTGSSFGDVPSGQWFSRAVEWAVQNGFTTGTGNGCFSPNAPITRETLAQFLYNYSMKKGYDVSAPSRLDDFSDASSVSDWAKNAVNWAVARGLISGTTASTVSPKMTASRAQVALIIAKYVKTAE